MRLLAIVEAIALMSLRTPEGGVAISGGLLRRSASRNGTQFQKKYVYE